jgi:tRNA dimethylallyltransferase
VTVIAIFGPTASGKTAVAEALASRLPAEIVSADSMQVYRGLPILTNQGAGRLVGIWPLDRQGTVGEFQRLAHEAIDDALATGRTPIVVGGSGLYFRAALIDLELPPEVPEAERARWARLYERRGAETAYALLRERDPRAAAQVHPNDRKRVVRALELWSAGASLAPSSSRLWTDETRHPTTIVVLDVPRDVLDARIAARTREMFERGVEQEVRDAGDVVPRILGLDAIRRLPANEAEEEVVRATRRLAAYQRKWMRRLPGAITVDGDRPAEEIADTILGQLDLGVRKLDARDADEP